jgi:hypothetical protein
MISKISSASHHHDCVFLLLQEMQATQHSYSGFPEFWADYSVLSSLHPQGQELMKSVGSHGSLSSLVFMMKVNGLTLQETLP